MLMSASLTSISIDGKNINYIEDHNLKAKEINEIMVNIISIFIWKL